MWRLECGGSNPIEQWWWEEHPNVAFPGRFTLIFGAGISMAAPTNLPSGVELTKALMAHLLDQRAYEEILQTYKACESMIGRSVPRLEHVLDIACNHEAIGEQNFGAPRELLRIFEGREPNALHEAIATHLVNTKSWAITTNFDNCVERASNFTIPVYFLNPDKNQIEVIPPHRDSGWGLIKVHGTIGGDLKDLGATLANIDGGLPQPMQELLDHVMDESDLVVVAGYSGSDHFDINQWIAGRMNSRHKPKLIWIQHSKEIIEPFVGDDRFEPNVTWNFAFGGKRMRHGPTRKFLSELLTTEIESEQECISEEDNSDLSAELAALYQPSAAQKHLNGARLAAAIGLGQLAEEELRCAEAKAGRHPALDELQPDVFEQSGLLRHAEWRNEYYVRDPDKRRSNHVRIARKLGKNLKTFVFALKALSAKNNLSCKDRASIFAEFSQGMLDIVEVLQRMPLSRVRFVRWTLRRIIDFFWQLYPVQDARLQAHLTGRLQQLQIRKLVLLEDLDDDLIKSILSAVADQAVYPNLYLENGPIFPGFFLTQLSTLKELDQLSEWIRANLEYAKILSTLYVRFQRINRRRHIASGHWIRSETIYRVMMQFFENAREIANALGEPHLQVEVAEALVRIDNAVGGLPLLRPQRLYLAKGS